MILAIRIYWGVVMEYYINMETNTPVSIYPLHGHTTDAHHNGINIHSIMQLASKGTHRHISTVVPSVYIIIIYKHMLVHV